MTPQVNDDALQERLERHERAAMRLHDRSTQPGTTLGDAKPPLPIQPEQETE